MKTDCRHTQRRIPLITLFTILSSTLAHKGAFLPFQDKKWNYIKLDAAVGPKSLHGSFPHAETDWGGSLLADFVSPFVGSVSLTGSLQMDGGGGVRCRKEGFSGSRLDWKHLMLIAEAVKGNVHTHSFCSCTGRHLSVYSDPNNWVFLKVWALWY